MTTIAEKAKALADRGFAVFPVRPDKTPYAPDGLKSASLDGYAVLDTFEKYKNALIAIHCGLSGIVVLDIDYKTDAEGNTLVDGFDSLDKLWLPIPESFDYPSLSGNGKHIMYAAPAGRNLPPKAGYRKMAGVDRRSGESYVVFTADTLPEKASLTEAPEWLCDESTVHDANAFEGEIKEWFSSLEVGEPSLVVRRAMEDLTKLYEAQGHDLSHSDIVEAQHRAVRLGAEAHPGIEQYLALIEEYALNREGAHSRTPDEYAYEFAEALHSGIQKHGAAIKLRADLPAYSPSVVPGKIPDRLFLGAPGNKADFSALLRALQEETSDDPLVTSILWNAPKTRELSREWGLEFVHSRVLSAREKPEPIRENPTLPEIVPLAEGNSRGVSRDFLSPEEKKCAMESHTFIDDYLAASSKKGFSVSAYDIPGAWTALSMAVGPKVITRFNGVGVNLWFISMGTTGTGKSVSQSFLSGVLDLLLLDGEGNYNLGANSSPAGIHEELLVRDGKASMIHHDEAASFFSDLTNSEWFKSLEHHFSKFYDGVVEPSNKVRLDKSLRGKKARTSFNLNMSATPEKLLKLVTLDMFESGFLSRVNWTWAPPREEDSNRYRMAPSEVDAGIRTHPAAYGLASDLVNVGMEIPNGSVVDGTPKAWARLSQANEAFHEFAKSKERYDILQGPLTRLSETMVKCSALLALYRGETVFTLNDVLVVIRYCTEWLHQFVTVVGQASESAFSRDANEIEAYIKAQGGTVTEAKLMNRFRAMVRNSPRELSDRVDFLRISGRINRVGAERGVAYVLNG